jgi:hypothetical protein
VKETILVAVFIAFYFVSFGQTDTLHEMQEERKSGTQANFQFQPDTIDRECTARMVKGRMTQVVNGETILMRRNVRLINGTVIKKNGTVRRKSGELVRMKDGECVNVSGRIIPIDSNQGGTK